MSTAPVEPLDQLYAEDLLEEARQPACYGLASMQELQDAQELPISDEMTQLETIQYNASCGDQITVRVFFNKITQLIEAVRWEGTGCIISQASMSALARSLEGKTFAQVRALGQEDILALLGLPSISMGRVKCLLLGLGAIQKITAA